MCACTVHREATGTVYRERILVDHHRKGLDFVQPTRVFKSREIEAFLGEVHDQRAIASPSRASLQKMAAPSIGADNVGMLLSRDS